MIRKEQGGGIQAGGKGAGSLWWTVIVNSVLIRVWRQGQLAQKNVHNLGNENMITWSLFKNDFQPAGTSRSLSDSRNICPALPCKSSS